MRRVKNVSNYSLHAFLTSGLHKWFIVLSFRDCTNSVILHPAVSQAQAILGPFKFRFSSFGFPPIVNQVREKLAQISGPAEFSPRAEDLKWVLYPCELEFASIDIEANDMMRVPGHSSAL